MGSCAACSACCASCAASCAACSAASLMSIMAASSAMNATRMLSYSDAGPTGDFATSLAGSNAPSHRRAIQAVSHTATPEEHQGFLTKLREML